MPQKNKTNMKKNLLLLSYATLHCANGFTAFVARSRHQSMMKHHVRRTDDNRILCTNTLLFSSAVSSPKDKVSKMEEKATTRNKKKLTPEAKELEAVLKDKKASGKLLVAQTAPAVRVSLSEEFGLPPGDFEPGILVSSLKELGFDLVLDTNVAADLTICEEGTELLHRILRREELRKKNEGEGKSVAEFGEDVASIEDEPLPLFTSCCPGWLNMIEKSCADLVPYVSSCKSPHMMYGAVIKRFSADLFDGRDSSDVYLNSVMPCVRKRGESDRPAFTHENNGNRIRDVDNVITTEDLGTLLHLHNIDPTKLTPVPYDSPFQDDRDGYGSGAGQLFGATGGVMEAAVRSVYELVTGTQLPKLELEDVRGLDGVKETTVPLFNKDTGEGLEDIELRVAVANGLGNAKKLINKMRDGDVHYDFVEVMACPGGCIGGGGQPKSKDKEVLKKRLETIYQLDKTLPIRRSHESPVVKKFYERHLGGEFGSEIAHDLLHVRPIYGEVNPCEEEPDKEGCECVLDPDVENGDSID